MLLVRCRCRVYVSLYGKNLVDVVLAIGEWREVHSAVHRRERHCVCCNRCGNGAAMCKIQIKCFSKGLAPSKSGWCENEWMRPPRPFKCNQGYYSRPLWEKICCGRTATWNNFWYSLLCRRMEDGLVYGKHFSSTIMMSCANSFTLQQPGCVNGIFWMRIRGSACIHQITCNRRVRYHRYSCPTLKPIWLLLFSFYCN